MVLQYMHQVNQKIKNTITNTGPPDVVLLEKRNNITYIVFLQMMFNLNLTMKKQSDVFKT